MDEASLRERVRRLTFAAPALSEALLAGNFRSVFKGRGMDFESLREYGVDDDALRIDWNATARFGRPFVKTYRDDRDLSLYLVVDESPSMDYGTGRPKRETAALAASLLCYAASLQGLRVGALFFGGTSDERAPSKSEGRGDAAARALMERLAAGPVRDPGARPGSDLGAALSAARAVLKRRSLVVIVSDFLTTGYALPLALLARRHDVVALTVRDEVDQGAPALGFSLRASDAESGAPRLVVPRSSAYREDRARQAKDLRLERLVAFSAAKVPYLELGAHDDPVEALVAFFGRRRRAL